MKKFFGTIGKILFGMHLWIPIVYSLVFLVIAAISNTLGGSWPFYFIGLSLSFAGALVLLFVTTSKKEKDKSGVKTAETHETTARTEEAAPLAKSQPASEPRRSSYVLADETDYEETSYRAFDEQSAYSNMTARPGTTVGDQRTATPENRSSYDAPEMRRYYGYERPVEQRSAREQLQPQPQPQPQYTQYYQPQGAGTPPPQPQPQTAHDALYSSFASSPSQQQNFSSYVQPMNVQGENTVHLGDYEAAQAAARMAEAEKPKIYRTRERADVLIYEYTDRYEKYRVLPSGEQERIGVEYKNKGRR